MVLQIANREIFHVHIYLKEKIPFKVQFLEILKKTYLCLRVVWSPQKRSFELFDVANGTDCCTFVLDYS